MNQARKHKNLFVILPVGAGIVLLGAGAGYAYVRVADRFASLSAQVDYLTAGLGATKVALYNKTTNLAEGLSHLDQRAAGLSTTLSAAQQEIESTSKNVQTVQTRVGGFEQTVGQISGTVNTLEKLSKTDKELLQKYSKVYFLNEHFVPDKLVAIDSAYRYSDLKLLQIHALVWPHLKQLLDAAKNDGLKLYIQSAYRSFNEQASIKSAYTVTYSAGTANQFSADQGYSEHQLGTTVDFITTGLGGQLDGFDQTPPYQWLLSNGYKYGFVLSYNEGNAYYMFEPWHWRFVGIELATRLQHENKHFYDLEQRQIDPYLVNIFD